MTLHKISMREWAREAVERGKPSSVIKHIDELARGDKVAILDRCSTSQQSDAERKTFTRLRHEVEQRGGVVVPVPGRFECSGRSTSWRYKTLLGAALDAKAAEADYLLARCTDRFGRSHDFHHAKK